MDQQEINLKREKLKEALRLLEKIEFNSTLKEMSKSTRSASKALTETFKRLEDKFNQIIKEL